MKNNIFSLVSYRLRRAKKVGKLRGATQKMSPEDNGKNSETTARILKLRKEINSLKEIVSSL